MARGKGIPSYGELAYYQDLIDDVRDYAMGILAETDYYVNECGGMYRDGEIFAESIESQMMHMQATLNKIRSFKDNYDE